MAGIGSCMLKSLRNQSNSFTRTYIAVQTRNAYQNSTKDVGQARYLNHNYYAKARYLGSLANNHYNKPGLESAVDTHCYRTNNVNKNTILHFRNSVPLISMGSLVSQRSYSSFFGSKGKESLGTDVGIASGAGESNGSDGGVTGSEWADKAKDIWQSTIDVAAYTTQKANDASNEVTIYVQQLLDSHPVLNNVIVPISWTLTGTIFAWLVMPTVFRKFHNYAMQRPASLLYGTIYGKQISYEESFWGALEDPVRYLITFLAFTQIGMMIAPTTIAAQYIAPIWRCAIILSIMSFLYRWKTYAFSRMLASQSLEKQENVLIVDKISSVALAVFGSMALAEAWGVAVQSILTVGGIGGVATAFAAKDILGNVLSGFSVQFSKPFSVGETIKAGSIEGQVVDIGLTTTSLLNAEKFPVLVPNSLFSSQVIVNKSRAQCRAYISKIPLHIDTLDKIPEISEDIKTMLNSNSQIFEGKEIPYCFLSRVESAFAELTIGCNLKKMSKAELYSSQQALLLQTVQIIQKHGGKLGSYQEDTRTE